MPSAATYSTSFILWTIRMIRTILWVRSSHPSMPSQMYGHRMLLLNYQEKLIHHHYRKNKKSYSALIVAPSSKS